MKKVLQRVLMKNICEFIDSSGKGLVYGRFRGAHCTQAN